MVKTGIVPISCVPLAVFLSVFCKHNQCIDVLKWFLKNGQTPALFSFIFSLFKQTIQFLQQINVKNVMSIQYTVPGFEPATFRRESPPITTRPGPLPHVLW